MSRRTFKFEDEEKPLAPGIFLPHPPLPQYDTACGRSAHPPPGEDDWDSISRVKSSTVGGLHLLGVSPSRNFVVVADSFFR